jgi:hypothetical protein
VTSKFSRDFDVGCNVIFVHNFPPDLVYHKRKCWTSSQKFGIIKRKRGCTMVAKKTAEEVNWDQITEGFLRPFQGSEVQSYPGAKGIQIKFINARQVMNRLDEVVGNQNWSTFYRTLDEAKHVVECNLMVHGVSKADVGYPNAAEGEKNADPEPYKSAYSDALKRAAIQWGIGRHLYPNSSPAEKPKTPAYIAVFDILKNIDNPRREAVRNYIIENFGKLESIKELADVPNDVLQGALDVE